MTKVSVLEYLKEQLKPTGCIVDFDTLIKLEHTSLAVGVVNMASALEAKEFTIKDSYLLVKNNDCDIALAYEYITFLKFNKSW